MRLVFLRLRRILTASACLLAPALEAQQPPRWLTRLSVHGYVTQAYGVSQDHQIFGIPTEGTSDLRDLALQFRYDQDPKNIFVVQFRQERLGESPVATLIDDIELDWAFYERKLNDSFSFKAGRIPLPLGIFNEARGVGTIFPFYRPALEFYEGQYTSKTIEGLLTSFSRQGAAGWSFEADAYYGQWTVVQRETISEMDARDALGAQLWVNTPIQGVRFGTGAYRCTVEQMQGPDADYVMVHGSVEADLDRWLFAAEYLKGELDGGSSYSAWYGQAGTYLTSRISVHARLSLADVSLPLVAAKDYGWNTYGYRAQVSEDLGFAVNYAFHPSLVLKLEGHTNEGLLNEDNPHNIYGAPAKTRYLIASIAATF